MMYVYPGSVYFETKKVKYHRYTTALMLIRLYLKYFEISVSSAPHCLCCIRFSQLLNNTCLFTSFLFHIVHDGVCNKFIFLITGSRPQKAPRPAEKVSKFCFIWKCRKKIKLRNQVADKIFFQRRIEDISQQREDINLIFNWETMFYERAQRLSKMSGVLSKSQSLWWISPLVKIWKIYYWVSYDEYERDMFKLSFEVWMFNFKFWILNVIRF